MEKSIRELKNKLIPLLFSISMTYWAMCSFFGEPILGTMLVAGVIHIFLFIGFEKATGAGILKKVLSFGGTIIYFIITFLIISISQGAYGRNFFYWAVIANPELGDFVPGYWLGAILIASYGFAFTAFYFTCVRFRIAILFMVGTIPFMLQSAKTEKDITVPFIIYILLFFSLYVEGNWRESLHFKQKRSFKENKWYMLAVAIFVTISLGVSHAIPKPNAIPKLAYIDAVIGQTIQPLAAALNNTRLQSRGQGTFNPMTLKNQNKLGSVNAPLGDKILFEVDAVEPLYFRVQSWDRYVKNQWVRGNEALYSGSPLESFYKRQIKLNVITSLLQDMNENEIYELGFLDPSKIISIQSIPQINNSVSVFTNNVLMEVFLNPPGIFGLERIRSYREILLDESSSCYPDGKASLKLSEQYKMDYISSSVKVTSKEYQIIKQLDKDIFKAILDKGRYTQDNSEESDMYENGDDVPTVDLPEVEDLALVDLPQVEDLDVLLEAEYEMNIAYNNYTNLPSNLPQRIYNLAAEITSNKNGDYDKALAIEQFFQTSGFTYDLSSPDLPQDEDFHDFFIFESKRGLCVHFASSMVILARACGLPARYVEGYATSEKDKENGRYLIREKYAHAFPEVYIAGYGWRVFEPTVSSYDEGNWVFNFLGNVGGKIKNFFLYLVEILIASPLWVKILFIPFSVFAVIFMVWVYIHIRHDLWRKRVLRANGVRAMEEIFARIAHLLKKINLDIKKCETPSIYGGRVYNESGVSISQLTDTFNRIKYGGQQTSTEEIEAAMKVYNKVILEVKLRVGKIKSLLIPK